MIIPNIMAVKFLTQKNKNYPQQLIISVVDSLFFESFTLSVKNSCYRKRPFPFASKIKYIFLYYSKKPAVSHFQITFLRSLGILVLTNLYMDMMSNYYLK